MKGFSFQSAGFLQFLLSICLFSHFLVSCHEDRDKIIAEKVAERLEEYRKKKMDDCLQNLYEKAEKLVDSLLLEEAKEALQDSLSKMKPFKPLQPPDVLPIDSEEVKPIFQGSGSGG